MKRYLLMLIVCFLLSGFVFAADQIVINEIMYNSPGVDVEFIELYNRSTISINLTNWYILDDNNIHNPCMLQGTLNPGEYLVVVADFTVFKNQYPNVINLNANSFNTNGTGWSLGNAGDVVRLFEPAGVLHDSVAYLDGGSWPGNADGTGFSLELLHPNMDNSLPGSWDPSSILWGTPGGKNSVYTENVAPVCKNGQRNISLPKKTDNVIVTVVAYDYEGLANVKLFVNSGSGYTTQLMYDDGLNGDIAAGDSIFTSIIQPFQSGTLVKYYAVATDNIGQTDSWPNNAPVDYHAYTVDHILPELKITEVLAFNNTGIQDEAGEFEDWFEIFNKGNSVINLNGMFVSDALNSSRAFKLPSVTLNPGAYILIWADNDVTQGNLHANFRLNSKGESIALFETIDHGNVLIDGWKYGVMGADISMGFITEDATAPEYIAEPTPAASNETASLFSTVCINEFQATSAFGGIDDWVEIFNRGDQPFDLSGCFLSDNRGNIAQWTFPLETILNPGEFLVIYEDALGFGFSSFGDDVIMLTAPDTTTGLDFYDFGFQKPDISEGRYPDGTSHWGFFKNPTKGTSNSGQTGVENNFNAVPAEFVLLQNFPNPFNPNTTISFLMPEADRVLLKIYNVLGKEVATLVNKKLEVGKHTVQWQSKNMVSGIYYYVLTTTSFRKSKKMLLLR